MILSVEAQYRYKKLWATDKILENPESVIYDSSKNLIYASNINGDSRKKDNNGFITKISPDGKILEHKWITGLNAPKGMTIYNGKLYVADITNLVEIDINQGTILNKYPAEGASFLNDVTVNINGNVFVSDNVENIIYKFSNGEIKTYLTREVLSGPNGLYADEKALFIGIEDAILKYDYESREIEKFISKTDNIDGLERIEGNTFLVSDFLGKVSIVSPGSKPLQLFNTSEKEIMAADIYFVPSKMLLLVPTFYDNRIFAYSISPIN